MDSEDTCWDKQWFQCFPFEVDYQYNSRGFRDAEWPQQFNDLVRSLWCFGDSFTVGIGNPISHIWPQMLQQNSGCRTINVSMDGASNDWIANRVVEIMDTVSPKTIVIQWSYLHRRENNTADGDHESKRVWFSNEDTVETDYNNFVANINKVNNATSGKCCVIHSIVPDGFVPPGHRKITDQEKSKWPFHIIGPSGWIGWFKWAEMNQQDYDMHYNIFNSYKNLVREHHIITLEAQDRARDGFHYGVKTAQAFVEQVVVLLQTKYQTRSALCN